MSTAYYYDRRCYYYDDYSHLRLPFRAGPSAAHRVSQRSSSVKPGLLLFFASPGFLHRLILLACEQRHSGWRKGCRSELHSTTRLTTPTDRLTHTQTHTQTHTHTPETPLPPPTTSTTKTQADSLLTSQSLRLIRRHAWISRRKFTYRETKVGGWGWGGGGGVGAKAEVPGTYAP